MTLVDSDILIDFSRGNTAAAKTLAELENNGLVAISSVTSMELLVGAFDKREQRNLEKFFRRFTIVHVSDSISLAAYKLIQTWTLSHNLQIPDAPIAATATELNIPLASRNQKDYRFIPELNLLPSPY